jgi:hypothetical protein
MDEKHILTIEIAGQTVVIAFDPEAVMWYVHSSTVPGLTGEAATAPGLIDELEVSVRTLTLP